MAFSLSQTLSTACDNLQATLNNTERGIPLDTVKKAGQALFISLSVSALFSDGSASAIVSTAGLCMVGIVTNIGLNILIRKLEDHYATPMVSNDKNALITGCSYLAAFSVQKMVISYANMSLSIFISIMCSACAYKTDSQLMPWLVKV